MALEAGGSERIGSRVRREPVVLKVASSWSRACLFPIVDVSVLEAGSVSRGSVQTRFSITFTLTIDLRVRILCYTNSALRI